MVMGKPGSFWRVCAAILFVVTLSRVSAEDAKPGVVSFVKVVSDKVEDVSNLDTWKTAFIKEGMTDEQKALAIWKSAVAFRHQENPPLEYLVSDCTVNDSIKMFNVYGYNMCNGASATIVQLSRYVGLKAQGWGIVQHSVPEVYYDNAWHLLDASLITYFPKADGKAASVHEICDNIAAWHEKNPGFKGNEDKQRQFMRGGGWRKGPELLAACTTMDDNGWYPAATHGWYSPMGEYGDKSKTFIYEYGYSQGYQVNVQLREGERITRNWFNKGLHINQDLGHDLHVMKLKTGTDQLRYTPAYGDIAPGRVGNGTHEYNVPLASGAFRGGAFAAENLACKAEDNQEPALHLKDSAQPGTYIVRVPSSYVYLSGELTFKAAVGEGGGLDVFFSDNQGATWKELAKLNAGGDQKIDLKPLVYRRYDYRLKFVLKGKGTGLDALKITHDIQHSQRPLPALAQGSNTVKFSAGPAEGTITQEAHFNPEWKSKQLFFMDFSPEVTGLSGFPLRIGETGKGELTYTINTPNDMLRLRFGGQFRARDQRDGFDMLVSLDEGKTWKPAGRMAGPTPGHSQFFTFADIPAGTKSAKVKLSGQQFNTTCLFGFRLDADYKEVSGGFRPVKVTYVWDENGAEKRNEKIVKTADESYTIDCATKPTMKSLIVELAE